MNKLTFAATLAAGAIASEHTMLTKLGMGAHGMVYKKSRHTHEHAHPHDGAHGHSKEDVVETIMAHEKEPEIIECGVGLVDDHSHGLDHGHSHGHDVGHVHVEQYAVKEEPKQYGHSHVHAPMHSHASPVARGYGYQAAAIPHAYGRVEKQYGNITVKPENRQPNYGIEASYDGFRQGGHLRGNQNAGNQYGVNPYGRPQHGGPQYGGPQYGRPQYGGPAYGGQVGYNRNAVPAFGHAQREFGDYDQDARGDTDRQNAYSYDDNHNDEPHHDRHPDREYRGDDEGRHYGISRGTYGGYGER